MRRPVLDLALALVASLFLALPARADPRLDLEVLNQINAARTDPRGLADELRRYRTRYHGLEVRNPQGHGDRMSREGVAAVDEAIAFLERQPRLPPLIPSTPLARAAEDHVADQGERGLVGHMGPSGDSPADRVRRYMPIRSQMAESIAYGETTPLAVVRGLTVDDGVRDRGHRADLFDPELRYAGVACGPHRVYRIMCVIDFAGPSSDR